MEEMQVAEPKKPSVVKTAMSYGLFTGIGLILITFIFYIMGELSHPWINYLSMVVLIAGIILGMRAHRMEQGGFIRYGTALGLGVLLGLFAALVASFFSVLLFHVIDPAAMQQMLNAAELRILESMPQITDEQLELSLRMTERMMRPSTMFVVGILSNTFMALLFSLIIAAFIRKEPKEDLG